MPVTRLGLLGPSTAYGGFSPKDSAPTAIPDCTVIVPAWVTTVIVPAMSQV